MATITISKGQTLGGIAKQYGTSVQALMSANKNIKNANVIAAGGSLVIPDKQVAPTTAQQKPSGSINIDPAKSNTNAIVDTIPQQQAGSSLNFQLAMKEATNEASRNKKQKMLGMVGNKVTTSSALSSVVDMVKNSVNTSASSVFQSVMDSEAEKRKTAMDMLKTLADDGSLAGMSNDALVQMAGTAGISSDTALAWKARITEIKEMSDEKANLETQKLKADIAATGRSNRGTGAGNKGVKLTSDVSALFEAGKGEDGRISVSTYQSGLRDWVANGGTPADFYVSFPQEMYLTQKEMANLPKALQPTAEKVVSETQWQAQRPIWITLGQLKTAGATQEELDTYVMNQGMNPADFQVE